MPGSGGPGATNPLPALKSKWRKSEKIFERLNRRSLLTAVRIWMKPLRIQNVLALLLVSSLTASSNSAIGFVTANGSFQLNSSRVWDSATIFDGSTIETTKAPSDLKLSGGAQLRLAAESRAKVYQNRLILEKG